MKNVKNKVIFFGVLGLSLLNSNFIETNADSYSVAVKADASDISPVGISASYKGQKLLGQKLQKSDFEVHYLYEDGNGDGEEDVGRKLADEEFDIHPTALNNVNNVIYISTSCTASEIYEVELEIVAVIPDSRAIANSNSTIKLLANKNIEANTETAESESDFIIPELKNGDENDLLPKVSPLTGDSICISIWLYLAIFILSVITMCISIRSLLKSQKQ